jgi:hypothetical protein
MGGAPRGAVIETYDDHRIAMSFAVMGLKVPGIRIQGEGCVAKSFPDFWTALAGLGGHKNRDSSPFSEDRNHHFHNPAGKGQQRENRELSPFFKAERTMTS